MSSARATQAHYVAVVKKNRPLLHRQLRRLPWRQVPLADRLPGRDRGRAEVRRL
ncbi:hypothetical protein [Streptomyces sp. NPDC007905]|uniref:hypothetical protein n=1 Tax=Streptomyces sp. NPDC007905 TaxID=3364788 RepID=UPI0036E59C96